MPLQTRFKQTALELILSISSSEMTALYRFGRKIWTLLVSEPRIDNNTVGPYLVVLLLAWKIGYNLFISKELRLTEVYAIASSNRFARSITRLVCLLPSVRATIGKCVYSVSKQSWPVQQNVWNKQENDVKIQQQLGGRTYVTSTLRLHSSNCKYYLTTVLQLS